MPLDFKRKYESKTYKMSMAIFISMYRFNMWNMYTVYVTICRKSKFNEKTPSFRNTYLFNNGCSFLVVKFIRLSFKAKTQTYVKKQELGTTKEQQTKVVSEITDLWI